MNALPFPFSLFDKNHISLEKKKKKTTPSCQNPFKPPFPFNNMANTAVVLEKIDEIVMRDVGMPVLKEGQVMIEMKSVGICGSDVHYWKHGRIGHFICDGPMVLGHECAGIVSEVGPGCSTLKVGDRVALEAGLPCEKCDICDAGKYNLCPDMAFFATPPVHGSLVKFLAHPEKWCFKIPDSMTLEEGAMCEPLSVGVYACEQKARVKKGSTVAIFGAGPIGMLTSLVANGLGAGKIFLCDIQASRLDKCKELLGDVLVPINTTGLSGEEVAAKVKESNGGKCVDGSIDCAGVEAVIQAAILSTKNGGAVCLVGMGKPDSTIPLLDASIREVDLMGVFRYRNTYPTCIELLSSKKIDVGPLITHRFEYTQESVMDAFETCRTGRDGAIKCMINL